jgi:broad specificity phosphatase PhoE
MELNNRYFLLRHGQTIYQKEKIDINYPPDSPDELEITEEGREMVRASAEQLKDTCAEQGRSINVIFASPYLRTRESASIAAEIIGIKEVYYDDRLTDINLGEFLGRPMSESLNFYSSGKDPFNSKPKNGESWNDILERIESFIVDVEKRYKNKNILVVSHADPIWILAGYLRGYKTEEEFLKARKDRENCYPRVGQLIKV